MSVMRRGIRWGEGALPTDTAWREWPLNCCVGPQSTGESIERVEVRVNIEDAAQIDRGALMLAASRSRGM